MINDQIGHDIEVYKCRLCGHIETVSSEIGVRPKRCAECRIEASFVLVDVVTTDDQVAFR